MTLCSTHIIKNKPPVPIKTNSTYYNLLFVLPAIATEIRCQEKSKGGLCYEVILAEPNVTAALPKVTPVTPGKNVSAEEIEEKLKAAEDRRLVSY